jgi:hypothetical protein
MKMLQFPAKDKALKAVARGIGRVRRRPMIREGSRRAGGRGGLIIDGHRPAALVRESTRNRGRLIA